MAAFETRFWTGPRSRGWMLVVLAGLCAGTVAHAASSRTTKTVRDGLTERNTFEWSGHLAPGKTLEIKDVNGAIRAEIASGSEIQVLASKSARMSDPDRVKIEVIEHAGGVTLCTVYPSRGGGQPNECRPGEGGRMNVSNNDVRVDYRVKLPRGVKLVARTVNGDVGAHGLESDVEARTVNGSIEIATRGSASAATVNGSIEVEMGNSSRESALEFETVNGGITVTMPEGLGAEVEARTVNGEIETDFPLTVKGRFNTRRIRGTIGDGSRELSLATVNGDIRLLSSRSRSSR
ncbi:MAG TPA: DUF4097 family beta strand repeat-containing protein [Candidatus Limnocylindria bacterium]|nr:DUF4097 family beta strand repeat-containing protein [Candidatus Limnocylindria bacterium]